MKIVETPSYPVSIFIAGDAMEAESICLDYCDKVGFCVTVTETVYCYTGGEEAGVVVGLINYPRFPSTPEQLWHHASVLAAHLLQGLGQQSYTIQAPDRTLWISHREQDA